LLHGRDIKKLLMLLVWVRRDKKFPHVDPGLFLFLVSDSLTLPGIGINVASIVVSVS
jgi:hypothetical protein